MGCGGRSGDEWTPLPSSPGLSYGTSQVRMEPGLVGPDATGGLQAPVFLPSSCLCFSHSQKCSFFTGLLRSFPRAWARLWAGVSSGLAAVPSSSHLPDLGRLGPPTPRIPGSKGRTLVLQSDLSGLGIAVISWVLDIL